MRDYEHFDPSKHPEGTRYDEEGKVSGPIFKHWLDDRIEQLEMVVDEHIHNLFDGDEKQMEEYNELEKVEQKLDKLIPDTA